MTRDADIELAEDEADDLLVAVEQELRRQRQRGGPPRGGRDHARPGGPLDPARARGRGRRPGHRRGLLNLGDLMGLVSPWTGPSWPTSPGSTTQPRLLGTEEDSVNMFAALREGDPLVHHPYDAFSTSVQRFIEQAAEDPDVLAIKQTLYRTDGDSPIVTSLIQAAESGKQVVVLVEVKARGRRGLQHRLGQGPGAGRLPCRLRPGRAQDPLQDRPGGAARARRHPPLSIGTGNYNAKTARLYTDLGLLSCDEDLGADLTELFNSLTGWPPAAASTARPWSPPTSCASRSS